MQNDWLADNAGEEWKWREDLDGEDGWWCLDDGKGTEMDGRFRILDREDEWWGLDGGKESDNGDLAKTQLEETNLCG